MSGKQKTTLSFSQKTSLKNTLKKIGVVGVYLAAIMTVQVSSSIQPSIQPGSGYALEFNGTDQYIDLDKESIFRITSELTLSFWVNPSDLTGQHTLISQAGSAENGGGNTLYKLYFSGNQLAYHHEYSNAKDITEVFSHTFSTDEWVHIALVRSSAKELTLYVNGIGVGNSSFSKSPTGGGNGTLRIAHSEDESGSLFEGALDEVRIWDTALTRENIRDWMCKKLNNEHPELSSLQAYYRFDMGTGTNAVDQNGSYYGSLVNAPAWIMSSAPIGDESVTEYGNPSSVSLVSADGDIFTVTDIQGIVGGIQIYIVREPPNSSNVPDGFKGLESSKYWGVKKIGEASASYSVKLDYENSPYTGKVDSAQLVSRPNNSNEQWGTPNASNDVGNKRLTLEGQTGTEYMLGEAGGQAFPVEFIGFSASLENNNQVVLQWETAWELNNDYFQVERATKSGVFNPVGTVQGSGTVESARSYQFRDPFPEGGPSYYRLKQVDFDGAVSFSKVIELTVEDAQAYMLQFPNPFNIAESIDFRVNETQTIQAELLNIAGQKVSQLYSGTVEGNQVYNFKVREELAAGVYVLRIMGTKTKISKKLVVK